MKICKHCKQEKGLDFFHPDKRIAGGKCGVCKACRKIQIAKWYKVSNEKRQVGTFGMYIPRGKGSRAKNGYVYIYRKGHPNAKNFRGLMLEHRFVMSEYLERPLKKTETVHHRNGIKHDNRIENLELFDHSHGPGEKLSDKVKWCIDFLSEYGYKVLKD